MAKYIFKCKECLSARDFSMDVSDFLEQKEKGFFNNLYCKECDKDLGFKQTFGALSSTIKKDPEQLVKDIQDEARIIANKVRSGDQRAIRNIYGEG